jgi:hypothetical protein
MAMGPPPLLPTPSPRTPSGWHSRQIPSLRQVLGAYTLPPVPRIRNVFADESADASANESTDEETGENGENEPTESQETASDPITCVRRSLERKDYSIEPFLLKLVEGKEGTGGLQLRLEAGSLMVDLHSSRGDKISLTTLAALERVITEGLNYALPTNRKRFISLFAAMGRLALQGQLDDAGAKFAKLSRIAEKVFLFSPFNMITYLACVGRLLENSNWDVAKYYIERTLSTLLNTGLSNPDMEGSLRDLLKMRNAESRDNTSQGREERGSLFTMITPSLLDTMFDKQFSGI